MIILFRNETVLRKTKGDIGFFTYRFKGFLRDALDSLQDNRKSRYFSRYFPVSLLVETEESELDLKLLEFNISCGYPGEKVCSDSLRRRKNHVVLYFVGLS